MASGRISFFCGRPCRPRRCCLEATFDVERLRRYQPCSADQVVREVVDKEYVIDTNANLDERLRRRRHIDQEDFLLTRCLLRLGRWPRGKQRAILRGRQHADLTLRYTVQLGCWGKNGAEPAQVTVIHHFEILADGG